MHIPRATYRFQFNEHFCLSQAEALVPYLHDLGISHIYASPLFLATPHSTHGYDVCDFNRLNPEIGTEADLEKLIAALHNKKMGLILDLVPNHMGISSPANRWWWDVLANGQKSPYAGHFDIDWKSMHKQLSGKILVPVLGDQYDVVLKRGELKILREADGFVLGYHEHRLPLAPPTTTKLPAEAKLLAKFNADFGALDKLIRQQHYHLAFYEEGDFKLNYRRFFAISTLAAVRVEEREVFEATHTLIHRWWKNGWLDGLRVDHPDGLRDPETYLRWLRDLAPQGWIVVEKILEPGEQLPPKWPVAGTTGYDFLNQINGLFIDSGAEKAFTDLYASFTGESTDYVALVHEKKRAVLATMLVAELDRITALLARVAAGRKVPGKFLLGDLRAALAEIIVCFPVYRSYLPEGKEQSSEADLAAIKFAVHLACEERKDIAPEIFAFIHSLLLRSDRRGSAGDFVARFQQLTGAVMAKGVEDTAFYCFNQFISLNEVGGDPAKFGRPPAAVHQFFQQQRKAWPHAQLATSTHDTKRSEDLRARLNVLSEIPEVWAQMVQRWSTMNACHRRDNLPDRNAEYLFYQTLAGMWPVSVERVQSCLEKAARESRQHTTWTKRNEPYEKALQNFISETMRDPQFTADVEKFASTLATAAAINSLAQTLVKLTAPGVPDIYQGCELWDFSMVDPDNRRPVDYQQRQHLLEECQSLPPETIWSRHAGGLPKLWLIQKTLKLRAQHPQFGEYDYQPLSAQGERAENIFAFLRQGKILPVIPRFNMKLNHQWPDIRLVLPGGAWRNEFSGEDFSGEISPENLFRKFPVALLVKKEDF
jgi:(1->4)-alpha-D-glucan 1-alpha-D-glucosylmutase